MSENIGGISWTVDADTTPAVNSSKALNKQVDKAEDSLGKLDKATDKNVKANKSLGFSYTKLAKAIGTAIVAQRLWAAAVDTSNTQRDFAESLADLSAITGATGDDLKYMSDQAKKLGSSTKFTASQVATSFKLMASAKPDLLENAEALAQVTEQALLLATASGVELTAATSTVGSALNQFSADADEAARFVNVLAAGAKLGSSEVTQTAEALKTAGVAANGAGISFEETNAAIQVLSASAIKGEQAGTALRSIFLKLDTSANRNLRPSVVGLNTALENLSKQGLSSAEMVKMFGLEAITAATVLVNSKDKVKDLTGALTGTNVASEQAAIKSETLKNKQLELQSAIEGLQITIGEQLNPAVQASTSFMTELTKAVDHFFKTLNKGSVAQLTTEMVAVDTKLRKIKERNEQGGFFYSDLMRKNDEMEIDRLEKKMLDLRTKLNKAQGSTLNEGFVGPLLPNDFVKSPNQGKDDPIVKEKKIIQEEAQEKKNKNPFADTYGDVDGGFATGISLAITAENETLLDQLERQRELILEFQEMEYGDAQAHADALIAIDQQMLKEKMRIGSDMAGSASDMFGSIADIMEQSQGEQSGAYKAMFAISKGFAVAQAGLDLSSAIMSAFNDPAAITTAAKFANVALVAGAGAGFLSAVAGATYSGRENGGPVSAGQTYEVGEKNKPEMLMIPGNNGKVFSNAEMKSAMGGGGGQLNQTINNYASSDGYQVQTRGDGITAPQVIDIVRAEMGDANSYSRRSLGTTSNVQNRQRGRR